MKPIGLQLYTLRGDVHPGGNDLPSVLKTVADIGYKGVEFAGLHGFDPKEIRKLVDDLGLQVCSSHAGVPNKENVRQLVDQEATLGNTRVIGGFGPDDFKTMDACKATAAKFNEAVELLKPHGMTFGFHNHWWEFVTVDGKYGYDIVMTEAPGVFSELDVYWAELGMGDAAKIAAQYKSQIPLLHIKDGMLEEGKHVHTAVGSGKLDMHKIVGAADPDVLKWLIVELDACETNMLEAVKESYKYLTAEKLAEGKK